MIADYRHLFDLPKDVTYLNCAFISPLLKSSFEAGVEGMRLKSRPWEIAPADFFTGAEHLRELFARLINAKAAHVAFVPAASYGIAIAAKNVETRTGGNIVLLEEQFPSDVYVWKELALERGLELRFVPKPRGTWTEAVLRSIDAKTCVVSVPNVHWTDGGYLDLPQIGAAARRVGAALVVDATQSLGAMPLDVERVQPDFLICASYKWLLGPPTCGFLYVSERHLKGRPLEHNWLNRKGSEDFTRLVDYQDEFQPGARRYDSGQKSSPILLPIATKALETLLEIGVEQVQSHIAQLTGRIAERLPSARLSVRESAYRSPHMLAIHREGGWPDELAARLKADRIFVSMRGDGMRVSPNIYNSIADIDRLLAALREP